MSCLSEVLSTKEVLLDHLYAVIKPLAPEYVDRIVGMLAECSEMHLMTVLGNKVLLEDTIDKAVSCLKGCKETDHQENLTEEKTILGNELFQMVAEMEPSLCAQITGMLLEMNVSSLRGLLLDKESLHVAVQKAKQEYMAQHQRQHTLPDELAERLYEAVSEVYDKNAAKVTGMLAELTADEVEGLLRNPSQFKQMLELCREALEQTQQWVTE